MCQGTEPEELARLFDKLRFFFCSVHSVLETKIKQHGDIDATCRCLESLLLKNMRVAD